MDLEKTKTKWERLLPHPDWYITVVPEVEQIRKEYASKSEAEQDAVKAELYDFFELHLKNGDIALEKNPPSTDKERKPIDTIVIHHTSNPSGMSKDRRVGNGTHAAVCAIFL